MPHAANGRCGFPVTPSQTRRACTQKWQPRIPPASMQPVQHRCTGGGDRLDVGRLEREGKCDRCRIRRQLPERGTVSHQAREEFDVRSFGVPEPLEPLQVMSRDLDDDEWFSNRPTTFEEHRHYGRWNTLSILFR